MILIFRHLKLNSLFFYTSHLAPKQRKIPNNKNDYYLSVCLTVLTGLCLMFAATFKAEQIILFQNCIETYDLHKMGALKKKKKNRKKKALIENALVYESIFDLYIFGSRFSHTIRLCVNREK